MTDPHDTSGLKYHLTNEAAKDALQRELTRAQQELDDWTTRAKAVRISFGSDSPHTAACNQMVEFWTKLRDTARAALTNVQRPIATLRLRHNDP